MPFIDEEPSVLTPRGFGELPKPVEDIQAEERRRREAETPVVPTWSQSPIERAIVGVASAVNPIFGMATDVATSPVLGAAFRSENTLGSAVANAQDTWGINNDLVDPTYSSWDDIKGTKYEAYWKDTFIRSNNPGFTGALKASIDRQEDDRRTVEGAGLGGFISGMIAGVVDPTILIPGGGEIALAGKGMWAVGKGVAAGARAGAVGVAVQEGLLQSTQDVRTAEESLFNIATGAVLGAVLGGSVAGVLSRKQQVASGDALEALQSASAPTFGDAGAAAASQATISDLTISGKLAENVAAGTAFSPNLRGNFRESPLMRQTYQEISSNPLILNLHEEGKSLGASVRDNIEVSLAETLGIASEAHKELFSIGKKNNFGMAADVFETEIAKAMRRSDVHDNEFVAKAAAMWRSKVIDPLSERAIKEGMLPEDVDVKEAPSYFSRMYNREAMTANRPGFISKTVDYFNAKLKEDYTTQATKLRDRTVRLDQEAKDLTLTPEERTTQIEKLQARLAALEEANPQAVQLQTKINVERAKMAKATGDEKSKYKENIAALRDSGGDEFKDYLKERDNVTRRNRALNFNVPGLAEKIDKIDQSIQSMVEANDRALNRVLERGRKLAKELKKYDEEKLKKTLSDLRSQFHQLIEQSNRAQERLSQTLAKLKDLPDEQFTRLEKEAAKESARFDRLNKLDERLELAEALDYKASVAEIEETIQEMIKGVSAKTLTRGEKIAAWKAKMAKLDPKKIEDRIKTVAELKKDLGRKFADRWEGQRLGKGVDPMNPEAEIDFNDHAKDLATETYNRIMGNDYGSDVVDPDYRLPIAYGPLKDRTFHIPDEQIEEFLENNVTKVMSMYARRMSAQIELKSKFGDINMQDRIREIEKQYDLLEEAATTPEARAKLAKDRKNGLEDVKAMRDQYLGTYLAQENSSNWGRTVRGLMGVNYIRTMGGAAIPSISELYAPAIAHGLGRYMKGWNTLLTNIDAVGKLTKESKYAVVSEALTHHRLMTMAELGDPLAKGTAIERWIDNGTQAASKLNLLNMLTDFEKKLSSIITQDHLNESILKGTDKRFRAWAGIDDDLVDVMKGYIQQHGEQINGVWVANTDQWGPEAWHAVRAYRAAIQKSVSTDIVTRKVGDVPLGFLRPTARLLTQFKTFNMAAHSQMFLRATQMGQARFISGLIGLTTLGMFSTVLRAWRNGEEGWERFKTSAQNPGYMLAEGLDNTGLFTLPMELGNITESVTGVGGYRFNPTKTPLMLAGKAINPDGSLQGNSQRFNGMGSLDALAGPTVGMIRSASVGAGGAVAAATGNEVSLRQKRAAAQLVPFQSYIGMKEALQLLNGDSPYVEGD